MTWTTFDKRTGMVLGKHSARIPDAMLRADMGIIEGAVDAGCFIDPDTRQPCKLTDLEPAIKGNAITGLPDDCEIRRGGEVLATGDASFAVDYDEAVKLELHAPRCKPVTVTLDLRADQSGDVKLAQDVRELRAHAYPDVREQLDAFWKGGAEAEQMRSTIRAVKTRFPKKSKE